MKKHKVSTTMKPCSEKLKPRWARRKEDRPQELLCAALHVFGEKGYAGARLEDVAKRAGVSKGTVYLYYSNKEELLKAVVTEHISPIVGEAASHQDEATSSAQMISDALHLWWDRYGSTELAAITKLILSEANAFPELGKFFYDEVIKPWWDYLESLLKRGVAEGEFRCSDTEYAAKVLCAPLVTLGLWKHTMDACCNLNTDPMRYIDSHVQMVLNGLSIKQHDTPQNTGSAVRNIAGAGGLQPH